MTKIAFKILLVDDEESLVSNLAVYLEDDEYDVYTANSGEEALETIKAIDINIAVVDMRLPGIDGNDFIVEAHKINVRQALGHVFGSGAFGLDLARV